MSLFLRVAEEVLLRERRPLSAREIVARGHELQLFPDSFTGATPHQTMKSKLSVDIRRSGDASRFVRTRPGRFYLRRLVASGSEVYRAPAQRPIRTKEQVLVFPTSTLDSVGRFQGISTSWKRTFKRLIREPLIPVDRYEAELDDEHKQVITYVMVTRGRDVLAYRRGTFNRVEYFLQGADCVGFGGHVSIGDRNLFGQDDQGVTQCAVRELTEELRLPAEDRRRLDAGEGLTVVGLLNDDSSPTGRRHLAVVFRYEVSGDASWDTPARGEKSITRLRWLSPSSRLELNDFEYWSQLCLLTYYAPLVRGQSRIRVRRESAFRVPHLLCLVGQIGSGKTEASEFLQSEFGYATVNSGRVLAGLLGEPPVTEAERLAFQTKANRFISDPEGPKRLAEAILDCARQEDSPRVLVDGLRQRATFEELRLHAAGRVPMMYVHAPPHVAFEFYRSRSGLDATMLEFARVREAAVEADVPRFQETADAVVFNWFGREEYRRNLRSFFESI